MVTFNKALLGGAGAGLASAGQLKPIGDYVAGGLSQLMASTPFGAFGSEVNSIISSLVVAGIVGFICWLIPNAQKTP